jgi:hypothetical protein
MSAGDHRIGRVRVLTGAQNGKYPAGHSLCIDGTDARAVSDPSLSLPARSDDLAGCADLVRLSHAHADHTAGIALFAGAGPRPSAS